MFLINLITKNIVLISVWEVATGRCVKTVACGGIIRSVAWCPNEAISLIAVAADKKVLLINPGVGDHLITKKTDQLLEIIPQSDVIGEQEAEDVLRKRNDQVDNISLREYAIKIRKYTINVVKV